MARIVGSGRVWPQAALAISSVGLELLMVRAERVELYLFMVQNRKEKSYLIRLIPRGLAGAICFKCYVNKFFV